MPENRPVGGGHATRPAAPSATLRERQGVWREVKVRLILQTKDYTPGNDRAFTFFGFGLSAVFGRVQGDPV